MRLSRGQEGMTLLEMTIGMGLGAILMTVIVSVISVTTWLPRQQSDKVAVVEDLQAAERWVTLDANAARNYTPGASPEYGSFSWSDYTGSAQVDYQATYSYDAANGYLIRSLLQNGITASTFAAARNIASEAGAAFSWNPSTYYLQISLTSTVPTASTKEGVTSTARSAAIATALRPRSESVVSPPGSTPVPTPAPGSQTYYVKGNPDLLTGSHVSGGENELQTADTVYYVVDSTAGNPKQVVYTVQSDRLNQPPTISQIEVRFTGKSSKQNVTLDLYVKDSSAGFPAVSDAGLTFSEANQDTTLSFYLSPTALAYVNSLGARRVDLKLVSQSGGAMYTLSSDQILFIASP